MTTGDLLSCAGDYHPVNVAADQHHGGLFWQARQKVTREADCLGSGGYLNLVSESVIANAGGFRRSFASSYSSSNSFTIYPISSARVRMYEQLRGIAEAPLSRAESRQMSSARLPGPLQATTSICLVPSASASLNAARTSLNAAGCLRKTETSLALNLM